MGGEEKTYEFIVSKEEEGTRLDRFLASLLKEYSRSYIQKLIRKGKVSVGDNNAKPSYILDVHDKVVLTVPPLDSWIPEPEQIPLDIVYEDRHIIVINKPAGLVVHPAAGNRTGTLVNALLNHCSSLSGIGGVMRPGIIHRLDKNTTGLLVVAKTDIAHKNLARQLAERSMKRIYVALVDGEVAVGEGVVEIPLGRDPRQRERMGVNMTTGKHAVTHYRILKRSHGITLLEITLDTGRTHQIRVHMRYLSHPVVGDQDYGWSRRGTLAGIPPSQSLLLCKLKKVKTQLLHAARLSLSHPESGDQMSFEAPFPGLFQEIIDLL